MKNLKVLRVFVRHPGNFSYAIGYSLNVLVLSAFFGDTPGENVREREKIINFIQ
jgi:hypothetical protein